MTKKEKQVIEHVFGKIEFIKSDGGGYYICTNSLFTFHIIHINDNWRLIRSMCVVDDFPTFEAAALEAETYFLQTVLKRFPNIIDCKL